jgi:S1-C subfamily serine protease
MWKIARSVVAFVILTLTACTEARADGDEATIHKSVVKIFTTLHTPDPYRPWAKSSPHEATGSGVVIAGKRILTNAHVVNFASQISVQFDKSSDKLPASTVAIAPGVDLAVLKLADEAPFANHPPLPTSSSLPGLQQAVHAYGYPEGGSELSITRGIVSRIEFSDYYIGVEGLRIQIDAAINPGNSGGPVVSNGSLIGIVFSKLEKSDNIGYIIPMEEISLFLKDTDDGHYDGKPMLPVETQNLESQALRSSLNLDKKNTGVLVRKIHRPEASYPLKVDDILTKIGDYPIDNVGMVRVEGDRPLKYLYLVQRLAREGHLALTVRRKSIEVKLNLPVDGDHRRLFRDLSEEAFSYFIFGPIVFTEASEEYVRSMVNYLERQGEGGSLRMLYTGIPAFTRYGDDPAFVGERIVIVPTPMFSHKIGKGYSDPYTQAVSTVNGVRIKNLRHLVEVLRDGKEDSIEFTFHGQFADKIVFNRKEVLEATEEVLTDNGIRHQCSTDLAKVWDLSKAK